MPRRLIVLVIALLTFPASAQAAWFPAMPIDGPNTDVLEVGNIDVARDGHGAVAYLRRDGGETHAYIARLVGGTWWGPERVDPGIGAATEVKVAVGDDHRIAVAWIAGGAVFANVTTGGASPSPFTGVVQIGGSGASSLDIDLGVNGAAYAIWEQGGDVLAARLQDATWSAVPQPLDVDPALEAGTDALRPKIAVSAEGYAVATWGDATPGGTRVWARRITGLNLSVAPQLLTLPGPGNSDSPDIDIEDDGSFAWVVFRQDLDGASRTIGRRLIGSLFEAPEPIDAGVGSNEPRVDMSARGVGYAVAQATAGPEVMGSWLDHDHFQPAARLNAVEGVVATKPEVAAGDRNDLALAWRAGTPDTAIARGRFKDADAELGPEFTLSHPDLGPVADPGVFIGGDRVGDFAVAMVQGAPGGLKTLTVASYDRPPSAPFIESSQTYKRRTRPELRWRPGLDLWGAQTYRVFMDGVLIGQTTNDTLVPSTPLRPGRHVWQIEAVDKAGQTARSRTRTLRIDSLPPTLSVSVTGRRDAGERLTITARARDVGGAGMHHVTVDYGDRSPTSRATTTRHRYKRGRFTLKVAAVDNAGNVTRKQVRLRIRK